MIAFFDASALIYLLEGRLPFAERIRTELAALERAHPGLQAAVSRLSWLECRVGPMKTGDMVTLALFDAFFAKPDLLWVELSRCARPMRCNLPAVCNWELSTYC